MKTYCHPKWRVVASWAFIVFMYLITVWLLFKLCMANEVVALSLGLFVLALAVVAGTLTSIYVLSDEFEMKKHEEIREWQRMMGR